MKSLFKKIKFKYVIPISILILLLGYIIGTPIGALRFAFVSRGFIQTAMMPKSEIEKSVYRNKEEDNKMYQKILYMLYDNAPYDSEGNECYKWTVTRVGIFYYGLRGDDTKTY